MQNEGILMWLASKAKWSKKGVRHTDMSDCLNCGAALTEEALYCPLCGQKVHESKLTVWSLLMEFFAGLFNVDNSLYRSIRFLPVPGYLSKKFMSGKRKRFLNPIRFFLVSLIVHIAALNYYIDTKDFQDISNQFIEEIGQIKLYEDYLAMKDTLNITDSELLGIDTLLFEKFVGNEHYRTFDLDDQIGGLDLGDYDIDKVDAFEMPIDEFVDNLEPKDYYERLVLSQFFRTIRDPIGAVRHAMGTLIWSVLLTVFLVGLIMKLLYLRSKRFYVEHLIVLFHIHTFSFLITSIGLMAAQFLGSPIVDGGLNKWIYIPYIIVAIFFFLSIKGYYQQGWIKTFFKYWIIGTTYMIILSTVIVSVGFLSLLFFK